MIIDNIKIRKLENGFTVKYHIADENATPNVPNGYSIETYAKDKHEVADLLNDLVLGMLP